ncbi:MAG: hypothetical protein IPM52_01815 [Bacteroidetes bacterium]|nr:hypothetical protein [Bacteroidota bacterium]
MQSNDPLNGKVNPLAPFRVEEGYFDGLAETTEHKLHETERRRELYIPRAIAASFLLLLTLGTVLLFWPNSSPPAHKELLVADIQTDTELWMHSEWLQDETNGLQADSVKLEDFLYQQLFAGVELKELMEFYFEQEENEF